MIVSDKLPLDTIYEILSYLEEEEVMEISRISKNWTISVAARSDHIWQIKYENTVSITQVSASTIKQINKRETFFEKYKALRFFESLRKIKQEQMRYFRTKRRIRGNKDLENVKIVINGDTSVGKTCMLIVLTSEDHKFPSSHVPTVFDNYGACVNVLGKDIGLSLFDTMGNDELRPLSYTGAHVFLVCADCSNPLSLSNISTKYVPEIKRHCPGTPFLIVLTKCDLLREDNNSLKDKINGNKFVSFKEAVKVSKRLKAAGVYETSSVTGRGIKEVFDSAINLAIFGCRDGGGNNHYKCKIM